MPSTMELVESPTPSPSNKQCDSAFFDDDDHTVTALDRIKVSLTESEGVHARTASLDSGVHMQPNCTLPVPAVLSMRRAGSATQLRRPRPESASGSISNQTLLLIQKMEILEKKLQSMETQLKHERVLRLSLEAKVLKLGEDKEELAVRRSKASEQLEEFSKNFFATMDVVSTKGSMSPSPHPSFLDLRFGSRTASMSSISSGASGLRSRPLSGISIASN